MVSGHGVVWSLCIKGLVDTIHTRSLMVAELYIRASFINKLITDASCIFCVIEFIQIV